MKFKDIKDKTPKVCFEFKIKGMTQFARVAKFTENGIEYNALNYHNGTCYFIPDNTDVEIVK